MSILPYYILNTKLLTIPVNQLKFDLKKKSFQIHIHFLKEIIKKKRKKRKTVQYYTGFFLKRSKEKSHPLLITGTHYRDI
jgi:hypothetical protein